MPRRIAFLHTVDGRTVRRVARSGASEALGLAKGGTTAPIRRGSVALVAVLLLHLVLFDGLRRSAGWHLQSGPVTASRARLSVRLISPPAQTAPMTASMTPPMQTPTPASDALAVRRARASTVAPVSREPSPANSETAPEAATSAPDRALAVSPAASAPPTLPSLMDSEGTRRAFRQSARAPSLGEQLASSRDEPARAGAQERLAVGVKAAGKGDCAKGDYPGAGMGLLSLPFLTAAVVGGNCAK